MSTTAELGNTTATNGATLVNRTSPSNTPKKEEVGAISKGNSDPSKSTSDSPPLASSTESSSPESTGPGATPLATTAAAEASPNTGNAALNENTSANEKSSSGAQNTSSSESDRLYTDTVETPSVIPSDSPGSSGVQSDSTSPRLHALPSIDVVQSVVGQTSILKQTSSEPEVKQLVLAPKKSRSVADLYGNVIPGATTDISSRRKKTAAINESKNDVYSGFNDSLIDCGSQWYSWNSNDSSSSSKDTSSSTKKNDKSGSTSSSGDSGTSKKEAKEDNMEGGSGADSTFGTSRRRRDCSEESSSGNSSSGNTVFATMMDSLFTPLRRALGGESKPEPQLGRFGIATSGGSSGYGGSGSMGNLSMYSHARSFHSLQHQQRNEQQRYQQEKTSIRQQRDFTNAIICLTFLVILNIGIGLTSIFLSLWTIFNVDSAVTAPKCPLAGEPTINLSHLQQQPFGGPNFQPQGNAIMPQQIQNLAYPQQNPYGNQPGGSYGSTAAGSYGGQQSGPYGNQLGSSYGNQQPPPYNQQPPYYFYPHMQNPQFMSEYGMLPPHPEYYAQEVQQQQMRAAASNLQQQYPSQASGQNTQQQYAGQQTVNQQNGLQNGSNPTQNGQHNPNVYVRNPPPSIMIKNNFGRPAPLSSTFVHSKMSETVESINTTRKESNISKKSRKSSNSSSSMGRSATGGSNIDGSSTKNDILSESDESYEYHHQESIEIISEASFSGSLTNILSNGQGDENGVEDVLSSSVRSTLTIRSQSSVEAIHDNTVEDSTEEGLWNPLGRGYDLGLETAEPKNSEENGSLLLRGRILQTTTDGWSRRYNNRQDVTAAGSYMPHLVVNYSYNLTGEEGSNLVHGASDAANQTHDNMLQRLTKKVASFSHVFALASTQSWVPAMQSVQNSSHLKLNLEILRHQLSGADIGSAKSPSLSEIILVQKVQVGESNFRKHIPGSEDKHGSFRELFDASSWPGVDPMLHGFLREEEKQSFDDMVESFIGKFGSHIVTKTEIGGLLAIRVLCDKPLCGLAQDNLAHRINAKLGKVWAKVVGIGSGSTETTTTSESTDGNSADDAVGSKANPKTASKADDIAIKRVEVNMIGGDGKSVYSDIPEDLSDHIQKWLSSLITTSEVGTNDTATGANSSDRNATLSSAQDRVTANVAQDEVVAARAGLVAQNAEDVLIRPSLKHIAFQLEPATIVLSQCKIKKCQRLSQKLDERIRVHQGMDQNNRHYLNSILNAGPSLTLDTNSNQLERFL